MASYTVPGDDTQPFHPQPVPSFNQKQRGPKNPRKGKHRQNPPFGGNPDGPLRHSQPQSCFNCGSLDHWAQHCPEPRREFPAGSVKPGRPPKRQKTTGSHNTHYPNDPHYNHSHRPPQRGYTHPPVAHPGYQPVPMASPPYGPPTPMSANPHSAGPWPQEPPPPHYNSPQSYGPPHGLPTPMSAYGPQFPSPSTTMPPQQGYFPPQYSPQYGEPEYHRRPPFDHHQQMPPHTGKNRQSKKKWRRSDNVPAIAPPVEPWMEELQSLDIPDANPGQSEIVWRPANQVARPLPSTFDERDDVGMLPPFASLPPGMSVSRYILDRPAEEFMPNIKNTEDWPFMMADPIFLEISMECELVPIDDLIARRKQIFETHRIEPPPVEEVVDDSVAADEVDETAGEGEYQEREESVIHSDDGDNEQAMSGKYSNEYSPSPSYSLRVDYRDDGSSRGSYQADDRDSYRGGLSPEPGDHPVSPNMKTDYEYHDPQENQNSKQPYSARRKPGKNRGNNKQKNQRNQRDRRQQWDGPNRKPNQHEGKRNVPFDRGGGRGGHFNPQDRRKPKSQQFKGPTKNKYKKGPNNRGPLSNNTDTGSHNHKNHDNNFGLDGSADINHTNNSERQRSQGHVDAQQSQPHEHNHISSNADTEHNSRKRSRRDQSPARPDEPRRQEDDVTPKFKRRQPNVAEAYRYAIH
ncbi:hypothetical protein AJ79_07783 [Helicocarpus griseus UAMH5409]|uniref:CCHC-type domain-containing protein n=1 Tax=Helicocarpus griseus UAMH5409 TaxID=1447875 RepID=A0A2B7WZL0_9EURO|nr:hypothetical protein AJ79_07783 [Helicocarpus griseus UAMH5409]